MNIENKKKTGKIEQLWDLIYKNPAMNIPDAPKTGGPLKEVNSDSGFRVNRRFYLRSRLPMQRVMEAVGANNVVIKKWYKNRVAQQFFYDGASKTLKSQQWKSHSMDMHGNNLRFATTNSKWFQLFKWEAPLLVNKKQTNKVADVRGSADTEHNNVIMYNRHGKINQQWDLIYL